MLGDGHDFELAMIEIVQKVPLWSEAFAAEPEAACI